MIVVTLNQIASPSPSRISSSPPKEGVEYRQVHVVGQVVIWYVDSGWKVKHMF